MNCAVHQDAEAVGYCRNCGKPMCSVCVRPVRDVLYCEDCLARMTGMPATAPAVAAYRPPMPGEPAPIVPVAPSQLAVPQRPIQSPGRIARRSRTSSAGSSEGTSIRTSAIRIDGWPRSSSRAGSRSAVR